MAATRQLELYLLRFMPHPLRDDFVTVGLLLTEGDGGFSELRFTRDTRMLQCVAPDVKLEWFAGVETAIRQEVSSLRGREDLMRLVTERFGTMLDVAPTKAVLTDDPVKEMEVLTSMYLVPMERGERSQPRSGRAAIVLRMKEAFDDAGVLGLMQRDLDMTKYTGVGDPAPVDFGYRVGNAIKMFHGVSLMASVEPALALSLRYARIREGMMREQLQSSMTTVVDRPRELWDERTKFAAGVMEENFIQVRQVNEMGDIARAVRLDLQV
jgi:hypothetical protein